MDSPAIAEGGEGETRERREEMSDMERGRRGVEDVTQHQCQRIPHQQQGYESDLRCGIEETQYQSTLQRIFQYFLDYCMPS